MNEDPNNIKEIDEYLSGDLTPEQRNEFEKKLEGDPNLREELDMTKQVIDGVQGFAFKRMLKDMHKKLFPENS